MHKRVVIFLLILLLPVLLPIRARAVPLNDGFNPPALPAPVTAAALQPDGKIIVASAITSPKPYLARFNPDGTADADFHPPVLDNSVLALALQRDGSILVGGYFTHAAQPGDPLEEHNYLLRLLPTGELDSSFAPPLYKGSLGFVWAITVLRDGRILIGGDFKDAQGTRNLARLETTGSFDTTFSLGVDGWVTAMVQQKDDEILVGGYFKALTNGVARPGLARFHADGSLDAGYTPQLLGKVEALALQSDGSAIVGGSFSSTDASGVTHTNLGRFRPDGTLDTGFAPVPNGQVSSLALYPDDRILVGGKFTKIGSTATPYMARLDRSGAVETAISQQLNGAVEVITLQPDGRFLMGGAFTKPRRYLARVNEETALDAGVSAQFDARVSAISPQPNGGLLVGGVFQMVDGVTRRRVARLNTDWTLDTLATSYDANLNNESYCVVPDPDSGSAFICGNFDNVHGATQRFFAKVNPDGTLDENFRPDIDSWVTVAARQPSDGKLLIGGFFGRVNGAPHTRLARLLSDGSLDPAFTSPSFPPVVVNDAVYAIAVLTQNKILIAGGFPQKILRLKENGSIDAGFTPPRFERRDADDGEAVILDMVQQSDGKLVIAGFFTHIDGEEHQYIARLNEDGSLDGSFQVNADISSANWSKRVLALALQSDGRIIMGGDFDLVRSNGTTTTRQKVARLEADGAVDSSFDLGPFGDPEWDEVYALAIPQDGRLVVGGWFQQIGEVATGMLARLSKGTATHELKVSREGNEIQWLRGGSSAELWQVIFEESSDGRTWSRLGEGSRIPGGWSLTGVKLPYRQQGFVRARGYAGGGKNSTGNLQQAVRAYYLDPYPQTITFAPLATRDVTAAVFDPGAFASSGLPISYSSSNPAVAVVEAGMVRVTGAGDTVITASQAGNAQYYPAASVSQPLHVERLSQVVTLAPLVKSYGDADFNPGATASSGLSVGYSSSNAAVATVDGSMIRIRGVGLTTITASQSGDARYKAAEAKVTLEVIHKELRVAADPVTRSYGAPLPALSVTYSGFAYDESPAVLTGAPALSTTADIYSSPGSYSIAVDQGSLASANYRLTLVPGTLTVTKAPLTLSMDPASRPYGGANPTFNARISGFANGESQSVLTGAPKITTTATAASPPGDYPVTIEAGTLSSKNYSFAMLPGRLTVTQAVLTVRADGKSRRYGDPNPPFTVSFTGFVNGESPAVLTGAPRLSSTAEPGSPAGEYPIHAEPGTLASGNYAFTMQPGTLLVQKAPLTVTADSKQRRVQSPNPELTATFSGLVNDDTPASLGGPPELSTAARQESPAGTYSIRAALGSMTNANYDYFFVHGTLLVSTEGQSINFPPLRPKTFGDADFDPGATASSGLAVSYASSTPQVAPLVNGKVRVGAPGSTLLTASQPGNAIFTAAAEVSRVLLVNPPPWNGLSFDGVDDLVQVADQAQLNFDARTGFSVELWLRSDSSQPDFTGLLAKGGSGTTFSGYQLLLFKDHIAAEIGDGVVSIGVAQGLVGTSRLDDGQWHQVGLTVDRDAGHARLYLDGRLEAQVTLAGLELPVASTEALRIGVDRSGNHFFKGDMDELRVWGQARSREQIRATGSQIIDPLDEPQLAGYFHFDEGDIGLDNQSFATLPERTAHENHGILTGFALTGGASNWIRSGAFIPLLESAPISSVGATTLSGGGEVYPNYYSPTDRGLCWGSVPNPGLNDHCIHLGSGTGSFSGTITGLSPNTTYHVRGFATNLMGTAYGNNLVATTMRLDQAIDFGPLPTKTYGDGDFPPGGTTTSALPITYTSSDPSVATIVNGQIHIVGAGSTLITASQAGDPTYNRAAEVSQSLTVLKAALLVRADDKTRAFNAANPPLSASYSGFVNGDSASAISGSCVLSTAATETSPVGGYDIVTGPGTLAARNYRFVLANGRLNIIRSCQEIVFPPIGDRTFGDPPFQIVALACSGLTLSFSSDQGNVVRINGNILTIVGAGSASITARQTGSENVNGAADVTQTLTVHRSGQGITFSTLAQKVLGDPPFALEATASSGLEVSYVSSNPEVATVNGNQVSITGAGTCVISAYQQGNANYEAALPASQPLTVALEGVPPLLGLSTLPPGAVTAEPVLNVEGLAADSSGIAALTVNGSDYTDQAALFSGAVVLGAGENWLTVSASDRAGNMTTDRRSIFFDAAAPVIILSEPADNAMTGNALLQVQGRAPAASEVTLSLNGGPEERLGVDATGAFRSAVTLVQGVNTIGITATLSGRSAQIKRSVAFVAATPEIAITEPGRDLRTEQREIMLTGAAAGGAGDLSVRIEVNGLSFTPPVAAGIFQQPVTLDHAGEYRIKATATDAAGNSSFTRRNVIRVERIPGDLNGDGTVDIRDAAAMLRISLGFDPATEQALARADLAPLVNDLPQPDGIIDIGDVLVVMRGIVGLAKF